ncbi:MAG TPA: hypothetical protein VJ622_09985 [Acidimicrobiia bacterium]|nr:hypothetical protein [Acidimicrobiia bacterium]HKN90601.1 hypothetical protein [Acidimicrobiia bacterium]
MKRLVRERGRLVAGVALLVAAVVVLGIGYASIADELFVSIQLPYVLAGGVGALLCAGVGLVLLRSQDDADTRARLGALQAAHDAMTDRFEALGAQVEYVTALLEAVLRDDAVVPARPSGAGREVRI